MRECGFIESSKSGVRVGYSPDGLIEEDNGLIEIKSRQAKYQVQTICSQSVPSEYMLQLQFGLWVSDRRWIDFIQYSNGMRMYVQRVGPDPIMIGVIAKAVSDFESRILSIMYDYDAKSKGFPLAEYIQHVDGSEIEVSE